MPLSLTVEHQCPQCGAPITLLDTDRFFQCEYCRVRSIILSDNGFRYLLPNNASDDKDVFYFPYWRFKGMHFSFGSEGVKHRFVDFSHQAVRTSVIPNSVGLRSQALILKLVSSETQGKLLRPFLSLNEVTDVLNHQIHLNHREPPLHQAYIGESKSLLYSPFYLDSKLYDAVLNQPFSSGVSKLFDLDEFPHDLPVENFHFIPSICPECGWDLKGTRDALSVSCNNCFSLWRIGSSGLKPIRFAHIPGDKTDSLCYLPFWRIKASISGLDLSSYADLVRVANLPKTVQTGWEKQGFRFWIPCFKLQPQSFLRLARCFTLSQPQEKPEKSLPNAPTYPVTLPVKEAAEFLKIALASFMTPKEYALKDLPTIRVRPESYLLVYIPFMESRHDFQCERYQISVSRSQLGHSINL